MPISSKEDALKFERRRQAERKKKYMQRRVFTNKFKIGDHVHYTPPETKPAGFVNEIPEQEGWIVGVTKSHKNYRMIGQLTEKMHQVTENRLALIEDGSDTRN